MDLDFISVHKVLHDSLFSPYVLVLREVFCIVESVLAFFGSVLDSGFKSSCILGSVLVLWGTFWTLAIVLVLWELFGYSGKCSDTLRSV